MATTKNNSSCGLRDWIPVPSNDTGIPIHDLAVAIFNVPSAVFALLSNLAIIVTIIKTPSLQRPSYILLCGLATADCLTGIAVQPIFVAWRLLLLRIHESCSHQVELTAAFDFASRLISGLAFVNMAVITCDRSYALLKPLKYRASVTKEGVAKIAVFTSLAWVVVTVLSTFTPPRLPGIAISASLGALVALIPILNHIAIFIAIRRHNSHVGDAVSSQQLFIILKREKAVAKDMFVVTVVLFLCVLPKMTTITFRKTLGDLYYSLYLWSTTLTLFNSCLNPVLYLWRNCELRNAVRSVFQI